MGQAHGEIAGEDAAGAGEVGRPSGRASSWIPPRRGVRLIMRWALVLAWRLVRRRPTCRAALWLVAAASSRPVRWALVRSWRLVVRAGRRARAGRDVRRAATVGLVAAFAALFAAASASAQTASPKWELASVHGPTNVPLTPSVNEVYKLTVRGNTGKFSLYFENGETEEYGTTKLLPYDASAQEVQEALEKFKEGEPRKAIGEGNVRVTGGPGDAQGTKPYVIEFVGALGGRDLGPEALAVEETEVTEHEEALCENEGHQESECELEEPELTLATPGSRDIVDYQLILRNVGGEVAQPAPGQPITIKDRLPAGLTTKAAAEGPGSGLKSWSCTAPESKEEEKLRKEAKRPAGAGRSEIECSSETAVNADSAAEAISFEAVVDTSVVKEGAKLENTAQVSGGGAAAQQTSDAALVSATPAPFGVNNFTAATFDAAGETYTQAGGHPYAATTSFFFNTVPTFDKGEQDTTPVPPGNLKDVDVKLPAGFIGNPQAAKRCSQAEFTSGEPGGPKQGYGSCPAESQVGTAWVYYHYAGAEPEKVAVYDLVPPAGAPAEFGFIFDNVPIRLDAHVVREAGEHGEYRVTVLSADVNEIYPIYGVTLSLWGVPGEASHNAERFETKTKRGVADGEGERPFLTNPTDCAAEAEATEAEQAEAAETNAAPRVRALSPITTIAVDSWQSPGGLNAQGDPLNPDGEPSWRESTAASPRVTGCGQLNFSEPPTVEFAPTAEGGTTAVDQPSGYTFELRVPQDQSPSGLATPVLKDVSVTLPQGVSISPSDANGLESCGLLSSNQPAIGLESIAPGLCREASQIGTVKIKSPLLENELQGRVYIGNPECSPCSASDAEHGKLFKLFIEAEGSGVRVKLAGTASTNPSTGQVSTTFEDNPQLPFETLVLTLKNGPRAPLANPQTCGSYSTSAELTPWSAGAALPTDGEISGTPTLETQSSPFVVSRNGAGEACPASDPFHPGLQAGTESSTAGAYSPFTLTFKREDGEQDLSGITVQTPPGLVGKVAGVTRCAEPQAGQGTCPESSRIGTATSAAGSGPDPYVVSGPVYLTQGYKGAPFGLSIAVPAKAGPFDLGTVIVRAAINVNPFTAALTVTSDPLPQSIDGVPFRLKVVRVEVNRSEFMLNPTNCEGKSITAQLTGAPVKPGEGAASFEASAPFTASSCSSLTFTPTFSATTEAKTSKADGASLVVKVGQKKGEANIHKVEVQLPYALPARLTTLQKACTEAQFNANPAGCPEASNVGYAKATTPLLSAPLEGPAYLVSHGNAAFPDLEFLLQGEGVHVTLDGKTDVKKGITYSRFETVPDAPIDSFETAFPEGPHSVLAANGNLCTQSLIAPTTIVAQNGMQTTQQTKIAVTGCPPAKPSLELTKTRVKGSTLLVTVKMSAAGTVKISGRGLETTVKRNLKAGTHQIGVPLTKAGKAAHRKHRKLALRVSLAVGRQSAVKTATVRV
jgi:hypothetical protein